MTSDGIANSGETHIPKSKIPWVFLRKTGNRTYGFNHSRFANEFFNHTKISDFNWVVYYHRIKPNVVTLFPTNWDIFKGRLYSGGGLQKIYRPSLASGLPIIHMANLDLANNRIGMMMVHFGTTISNSDRKSDTGPYYAKITRLKLQDMTHELKDIKFDDRWSFDKSEYDPKYHDIFDDHFFRDELGLIGAMRQG